MVLQSLNRDLKITRKNLSLYSQSADQKPYHGFIPLVLHFLSIDVCGAYSRGKYILCSHVITTNLEHSVDLPLAQLTNQETRIPAGDVPGAWF